MKRISKFSAIIIALILAVTAVLSGCDLFERPVADKKSIICTIFPQYDWVRQILGDSADEMNITLLLDNNIDLHNYQPSMDDIMKISNCDLFIYVGGESDDWVEDALKQAANPDMVVINLLESLGDDAKLEELFDGAEDDDHGSEDDEHDEYDEHIWLSLKNAKKLCAVIADALSSLDADNAEKYKSNLAEYIGKLSALDSEYQAVADAAPVKTLLFGDRFPFRYLTDDYGLTPHAAFSGCSAETEASFETIIYLVAKVNELNLKTVMVTESSDKKIAEKIISESREKNQKILVLDSMQSVTLKDVTGGASYLSIMQSNLAVLTQALA
ncbi:MAG: metal ABC transporter substrate-binding protein [Oscillospiraceae bacterium]|nr:metal ABC transporter substrate-binding protein [Oscillospiraceae bacterium]